MRRTRRDGARLVEVTLLRLGVLAVVVALWELVVRLGISTPFWISSPTMLTERIVADLGSVEIVGHVGVTLYETLSGFAIGCVLGGISGYVLARRPRLHAALDPYLTAIYSLPRVALAPLFILWFGIGAASKIALGVSIVYFILLMNTYTGVRNVDTDLLNAVRTMGATDRYLTRRIILPSCVPWIFAGMRIGMGMALIGAVVGEMLAGQHGMGHLLAVASGSFDTTGVFSSLAILAVLAMGINSLMRTLEGRLSRWQGP